MFTVDVKQQCNNNKKKTHLEHIFLVLKMFESLKFFCILKIKYWQTYSLALFALTTNTVCVLQAYEQGSGVQEVHCNFDLSCKMFAD